MTEKIQKVKDRLIDLGFIDNEWLDKYLELIEASISNRRVSGRTQGHHAIPVNSYWNSTKPYNRSEALKISKLDKSNFKVHLLYRDHLLAHSYLVLCTDLEKIQTRYEAQAELRKHNSAIGVAAANKTLNKKHTISANQIEQRRAECLANVKRYYSADEIEEIMSL